MKIIHILNHIRDTGNGIVCTTIDLACEQSKLGHDVYIISSESTPSSSLQKEDNDFSKTLSSHSIQHFVAPQSKKPLTSFKTLFTMNKIFKKIKPDAVHAHMVTGLFLSKTLQPLHKYVLISTIHNVHQKSSTIMGLADKVITGSDAVKKSMIKRGVSERKIHTVRNGIIGSVRETPITTDFPLERPSISVLSGLYKRKGIDTLIKAFKIVKKELPAAHLYIIGEGPDRKEFETLASETEDIHFEGFQSDIHKYLSNTDIFVLPSMLESFGLALAEARYAGCACIGTNTGGIPEVLEQGNAGQIFDVGDHMKLSEIICNMLHDKVALKTWKTKAQENLEWLTVNRMANETLALYKSEQLKI